MQNFDFFIFFFFTIEAAIIKGVILFSDQSFLVFTESAHWADSV